MALTQIEINIRRGEVCGICYITTETGKILPLFDFAPADTDTEVLEEVHRILKSEPKTCTK